MSEPDSSRDSVFISYCHDDNEEIIGEAWIAQFHDQLRARLKQILGARKPEEEPGIYRDKELQGNDDFSAKLSEKLKEVAIVVSILSPSYVKSPWCNREIAEFVAATERSGGLKVDNTNRLFKILKTPVDRDLHPEPLQTQTGYKFYLLDPDTKIPDEFTLVKGDEHTALAKKLFNDLAHHIVRTLGALEKVAGGGPAASDGATTPEAGTHAETSPSAVIYLAETSYDLEEEQRQVRRELESQGHTVLPLGELPVRLPGQFRNAVGEGLEACQLAIHMIGAKRATVAAEETDDTVVLQHKLSADRSAGLERIIWMPPELDPEDPGLKTLVEELKTDKTALAGAELLQTPFQHLLEEIHDTLKRQEAKRQEAKEREAKQAEAKELPTPAAGGRRRIYVSYASEDQEAVTPLLDHLYHSGFDVLDPLFDSSDSFKVHQRNLRDCDAAILFADNSGEGWLKELMSELRGAPALRGGDPIRASAIYLGPRQAHVKARLRTHDLLLEGREPFEPDTLSPFLAKLEGDAEGA